MKQLFKKIKPVNLIRRFTQVIAFLLLPGLFVSVFAGIRSIYTSLISGNLSAAAMTSQLLLLAATILTTAVLGRFFCGFFCSFGALGDLIWFISKKTLKPRFKISEKADSVLKLLKYGLLLFLVLGVWTLNLISFDSMISPWDVFGIYSSLSGFSSLQYLVSVGGLLLLLIIIGSFFIERFFCRYLCPLGAIFAVVSKLRIFNIRKNREKCGSCSMCTKQCSMGIPLYKYDKVTSGECINCFACINHCPRKNAQVNPAPAVASAASVAVISGLLYMGNTASVSASDSVSGIDTTAVSQTSQGQYTDGTYTGSAKGFRGDTTVSVTVENGYITDITIVSYEDDREYFTRAANSVISSIIESQDVNVDAVSGATFSSNGIMDAVADALSNMDTTVSSEGTTTANAATDSSSIDNTVIAESSDTSSVVSPDSSSDTSSAASPDSSSDTSSSVSSDSTSNTTSSTSSESSSNSTSNTSSTASSGSSSNKSSAASSDSSSNKSSAASSDSSSSTSSSTSSNSASPITPTAGSDSASDTISAASSDTSASGTASSSDTQSDSTTAGTNAYTDGTYTGTGTGFRGDTTVTVTVTNGEITDITVTSYEDDQSFFTRAQDTVIEEIIANQDVNVDAVSGATFSSNGIMEAVANAIGVDYTNTNNTSSRGHGGPRR